MMTHAIHRLAVQMLNVQTEFANAYPNTRAILILCAGPSVS